MPRIQTLCHTYPVRAAGLLAGALVLTLGAPAAAAGATGGSARLSVRPHSVHPGGRVVIAGLIPTRGPQACPAADQAIATSTAALFPPDGFGPAASRSASGHFRITYQVPSSTPPGSYRLGARCGGGNVGVSATLQVD